MKPMTDQVVITGVGLAVPGLTQARDLLGTARTGGFDPAKDLLGRDLRLKDRGSRLALRAVQPALTDAGLLDDTGFLGSADRTAVVVSSNLGILENVCECADTIAEKGVTALSPLGLPQTSINVITGSVAIRYGLRGPNVTLSNGATSGLDALHWARNLIAAGRAEAAVVVGVEPTGEAATKLLGEECVDAAVALVLEPARTAAARRARPRAVVAAYTRTPELGTATARARRAAPEAVGLWLTPEHAGADLPDAVADTVPTRLSLDWLGRTSGALGVLQCAAAVAHLDADGPGPVLATAGGSADDAAAALLLLAPS